MHPDGRPSRCPQARLANLHPGELALLGVSAAPGPHEAARLVRLDCQLKTLDLLGQIKALDVEVEALADAISTAFRALAASSPR